MARLYYSFDTNLNDSKDDVCTPNIEHFIFQLKDNSYLLVGCSGESDWNIENQVLDGRMKGLEYSTWDSQGNTLDDWSDQDNSEKFQELLSDAKLVGFYIPEDDLYEADYPDGFIPECKNCFVEIITIDQEFKFECGQLMSEEALLDQFKSYNQER